MPGIISFFGDPFTTPNGSFTTTPTVGSWLLAVCCEDGASSTGGTFADNGADAATWQKISSESYGAGVIAVFVRSSIWIDSTANRTFTYTGSGTNTRCTSYLWDISGITANGTPGVIQTAVSTGLSSTTPAATFTVAPNSANMVIAMAMQNSNGPSPTQTAPAGFTFENNETDSLHFSTCYVYKTNAAPQTVTFGQISSVAWAVLMLELTDVAAGSEIADVGAEFYNQPQALALVGYGLGSTLVDTPPDIVIVTSLPPATASTPIVVQVIPTGPYPIRKAWIDAHFPGIIGTEVIHNSVNFGAYYTNNTNTRTTLPSGGYQFTILRDGGWPVGSFPLTTSFDAFAVDTIGNSTIP